eukprot:scaffold2120_cov137-Skeletonema_menzelii.AAC.4
MWKNACSVVASDTNSKTAGATSSTPLQAKSIATKEDTKSLTKLLFPYANHHHYYLMMHLSFLHLKRSNLPLFLFEEDWEAALAEIDCHPGEAKHWEFRPGFFDGEHESSVLPLHIACSLHAPLAVVKAIVEAYPEALRMNETAFKRLPIHVACQFAERPEVIRYLAQEDRATALEPDILGRLPIHYACSNGSNQTVIKALLAANPASALYADYSGWLPIHVAINFGASTEVIEELINACPASVAVQTVKGSTTVSLAEKVSTKNKEEILKLLKDTVAAGKCEGRHLSRVGKTSHFVQ